MAKKNGWLTGNSLTGTTCRQLNIPGDISMVMNVTGALQPLTEAYNWEQFGTLTPEECADAMRTMLLDYLQSECVPPVTVLAIIDLFALNAAPLAGAGTLTYTASASLPFGYAISTQNTTLHGMEIPCWFAAGEYDYIGWSSLTTQGGNTSVALTDVGGVVDTIIASIAQNGAFGTRVKSTGSFTVPADGFYNIVVGNISVAAGFQANWISHHIRQVS